jgi:uncharacterized protein YciI
MSAKRTFILSTSAGPAWRAGKSSREQPFWDEHAAFMDRLFAEGMVVMGGPYADLSGTMVILEAADEASVYDVFKDDPFVTQDVVRIERICEWHVFLDARRKS